MARPRIVVVGSSNTDLVVETAVLPTPGETVIGSDLLTAAGGKGANQAVAAARLGAEVTLVARLGRDAFGDQAIADFRREGVGCEHIVRDEGLPSGVALIMVGGGGENLITVAPGANAALTAADVDAAREAIEGADVVLLQLEIPVAAIRHAAGLAARAGVAVVLDPAPAPASLDDGLLSLVTYLTPNEHEARVLTGIRVDGPAAAHEAAAALRRRGGTNVLITLGAAGCVVHTPKRTLEVAGEMVAAVDSTAAGDTFNGAFAVGLGEGRPLAGAMELANAAAALSVTRRGAQPSMPVRRELGRFFDD